jgi:hypothetical protein
MPLDEKALVPSADILELASLTPGSTAVSAPDDPIESDGIPSESVPV